MSKEKPQNPVQEAKRGYHRAIRGGFWFNPLDYLRSSHRNSLNPSYRYISGGFRIARTKK